mmetsp:Transcript_30527/g.97411  ORF Transcript_30527/g.97411 Transcript_30527/m.97411 type:complete len:204 (+) Transcript_30527:524-1135(+)
MRLLGAEAVRVDARGAPLGQRVGRGRGAARGRAVPVRAAAAEVGHLLPHGPAVDGARLVRGHLRAAVELHGVGARGGGAAQPAALARRAVRQPLVAPVRPLLPLKVRRRVPAMGRAGRAGNVPLWGLLRRGPVGRGEQGGRALDPRRQRGHGPPRVRHPATLCATRPLLPPLQPQQRRGEGGPQGRGGSAGGKPGRGAVHHRA